MAMAQTLLERGELQFPGSPEAGGLHWDLTNTTEEPAYAPVGSQPTADPSDTINVRSAAARLGVHENTIRNWVDRGLLQAIRLPGSSFRRVRVTDLARLAHEMAPEQPPIHGTDLDLETYRPTGIHRGRGRQGRRDEGW